MHADQERLLKEIETGHPSGLTSAEILDSLARLGLSFSEASLRKYVQLGLLPRSVRVGQKGKHRGSRGVYPVRVLRQVVAIKEMMANDYTIEQIQEQFLFLRSELDELDQRLMSVFEKMSHRSRSSSVRGQLKVIRELTSAKGVGQDLMERLRSLEVRLSGTAERVGEVVEAAG